MKGCAITALVLCLLGCVLGMVGSRAAGQDAISQVVDSVMGGHIGEKVSKQEWTGNGLIEFFRSIFGEETARGESEPVEDYGAFYDIEDTSSFVMNREILKGDVDKFCPGSGFTKLDMEVGGCTFETKTSGDDSVYLEVKDAYRFQSYVEGDTLYIISTTGSKTWTRKGSCKITLYLPEYYQFEEVSINLGAGEMTFKDLWADEAQVEVGAGQITLKDPVVGDLEISVGAGQITLENMDVVELDVNVGMGEFLAKGEIGERAWVECSMGNIEMTIEGRREDFNYQVNGSMGNIDVGSDSYAGFSQVKQIDNHAEKEMEVECSMGNITIKFTED